jgi:hypothetical protein
MDKDVGVDALQDELHFGTRVTGDEIGVVDVTGPIFTKVLDLAFGLELCSDVCQW